MFFKTGEKVVLKFFIKNRVQHRCFPVNIAKRLRTAFIMEHRCCFRPDPIIYFG